MFPRNLGYEFAALAVICTLAIFLFPAARGPYSVVNGPASALLSFRVRLKFWLGMALAALYLLARVRPHSQPDLRGAWERILPRLSVPLDPIFVLRC